MNRRDALKTGVAAMAGLFVPLPTSPKLRLSVGHGVGIRNVRVPVSHLRDMLHGVRTLQAKYGLTVTQIMQLTPKQIEWMLTR